MTKKRNFKSFIKKIKSIFNFKNKDKEVPFYLPDEEPDLPKQDDQKFERTGVKKDFSKNGEKKSIFLTFLPSLFTAAKRPFVHQFFLISILFFICFFSARIISLSLTPKNLKTLDESAPPLNISKESTREWNQRTASLNSNDIFKTANSTGGTKSVKNVDKDEKCDQSDNLSGLPINLVSTSVLQDSLKSMASVQVRGKKDFDHFREGDEIDSLAKIFKIERLKLIFRNLENGDCEYVVNKDFEQEEKSFKKPNVMSPREFKAKPQEISQNEGIKQSGNKVCISRKILNEKLANFNKILKDAKALPITNPDGTLSFKIVEIQPGSIYSHLNIKDQDIIKSINGKPIKNYNDIMGLFSKIRSVSKLSLDLDRGGSSVPMKYEITKGDPTNCL